ncbi:MAG: 30S ribosomal protein S19e [Candidatus Thermoplasmatota archaeon]|nr:30S ribosomal protein S19e [Candidatus Thermoplasmatota archaeon]
MTTVYDVPAKDLIDTVAKKLREEKTIVPPEGCSYWRTGVDKEKPPENRDWWYTRCASVLRKLYITDAIGVERLRAEYGGNRDRRTKPNRVRKASGAIVRRALQQLEQAGYVTKVRGKGRVLTPKGRSFLDKTSYEVLQNIQENYPGLKKY